MIVVSDATPLIGLAKLGRLELLRRLFNVVRIPRAVYDEVVVWAPDRPGAEEIRHAKWIHVQEPENRTKINYLRGDLDRGEAEVLVLAEELGAEWVLLDEARARIAAELLGLRFIGTVGLLLLAKQVGEVSEIGPLLDELRAKRFYLSDRVCRAVLDRARE